MDKKHRQEQKVKKYSKEKKYHRNKSIKKESIDEEKILFFYTGIYISVYINFYAFILISQNIYIKITININDCEYAFYGHVYIYIYIYLSIYTSTKRHLRYSYISTSYISVYQLYFHRRFVRIKI